MQLTVNAIAENVATVEGPGVPIATYRIDENGIVRQFQRRRGMDSWVAVHSERIIDAVKSAFAHRERYQVTANDGSIIWTGEAESADDARRKAVNVERAAP